MSDTTISDYIPVSISTLQPAEAAGMNLYRREAEDGKFALYCAEDHPLKKEDLDRLHQRGIHRLFIESGCRDSFQTYLRNLINPEVPQPGRESCRTSRRTQ